LNQAGRKQLLQTPYRHFEMRYAKMAEFPDFFALRLSCHTGATPVDTAEWPVR
jgi:hypothetical protein